MWIAILSADQGNHVKCAQAFLFSIVNPHGLGPTKLRLVAGQEQNAIYCKSSYGPTFGKGHDLHISENANKNNKSYSFLGNSYQCPLKGKRGTLFTNTDDFTVEDYEVFGLQSCEPKNVTGFFRKK